MQDYHELEIWRRSIDLAVDTYRFTREQLPPDERFNLVSQLRRAAVSVPLNIAEGSGCAGNPDFARFVSYAYRSLKELRTGLELAARLYPDLRQETAADLIDESHQVAGMTDASMTRLGWRGPGWAESVGSETDD